VTQELSQTREAVRQAWPASRILPAGYRAGSDGRRTAVVALGKPQGAAAALLPAMLTGREPESSARCLYYVVCSLCRVTSLVDKPGAWGEIAIAGRSASAAVRVPYTRPAYSSPVISKTRKGRAPDTTRRSSPPSARARRWARSSSRNAAESHRSVPLISTTTVSHPCAAARSRGQGPVSVVPMNSEAVWWITIVDGILVRYHPDGYDAVLSGQQAVGRDLIEGTLALDALRQDQGRPACGPRRFIEPDAPRDGSVAAWRWASVPEPVLRPRGRACEASRYRDYEACLPGHPVEETSGRARAFLKQAAAVPTNLAAGHREVRSRRILGGNRLRGRALSARRECGVRGSGHRTDLGGAPFQSQRPW
jgi:hypothetical protein